MSKQQPPPSPPPPHPLKKQKAPPILSPPPPLPRPLKKQQQPAAILSPPPPSLPPPSQPPVSPPSPTTGDNKTYRDCIPGICSLNCPQFCTFLPFPPPPPFFLNSGTSSDDDSNKLSPLMASLIAVLAAAFLLLFYYTVISRYLRRRRRRRRHRQIHLSDAASSEIRIDQLVQDPTRAAGLDDSFIRQITVFKYRRGDGLVDGTECAVCLSEFIENESLRLMPNCEHAFHIPCIDTWLRSNSNCPLCRSGMNPVEPVRSDTIRTGSVNLAHMRIHRSDDTVLVVSEDEGEVVCHDMVEVRDNGEIKSDPSPLL